jgi:hypothetical protein
MKPLSPAALIVPLFMYTVSVNKIYCITSTCLCSALRNTYGNKRKIRQWMADAENLQGKILRYCPLNSNIAVYENGMKQNEMVQKMGTSGPKNK